MFRNALMLSLLLAMPAMAQEDIPLDANPGSVADVSSSSENRFTTPEKTNFVTLEFGGELTTHYFARGILQEDQGVIGQPWAQINLHLFQHEWLSDVYVFARTWNSFHSGPTGSGEPDLNSSPSSWYESQFSAGLGVKICNTLNVYGGYTLQFSPNDNFDTIQEMFVRGELNDGHIWDLETEAGSLAIRFDGLRPYGMFAWELTGQRDVQVSPTALNRGVYAEVGANPGATLRFGDSFAAKLSVPVSVGLNVFEYYEVPNKGDAPYGFTSVAFRGEIPLIWIPERYGSWSLYGQVKWYHLSQEVARFNSGKNDELIGLGGVQFSY